jgi:hypothetical protein
MMFSLWDDEAEESSRYQISRDKQNTLIRTLLRLRGNRVQWSGDHEFQHTQTVDME